MGANLQELSLNLFESSYRIVPRERERESQRDEQSRDTLSEEGFLPGTLLHLIESITTIQFLSSTPYDGCYSNYQLSWRQLHDANETGNGGSLDNAKCKFLNLDGTKVVVAEGTIASTDSKALVHHIPLGPRCWKV